MATQFHGKVRSSDKINTQSNDTGPRTRVENHFAGKTTTWCSSQSGANGTSFNKKIIHIEIMKEGRKHYKTVTSKRKTASYEER